MATFGEVLNRARQLLGAGDLAEAQRFYRQLVEAVPQAAEPWHELGILQLQAGRPEGAVECLRQAVTLDPGSATYHVNLATTYRMLKRPDEAIESFERALKLGSPTAELYNNLALSLKDTGQTDAALRAFDDALRLRPDYANGHFNRGNLLLESGRLEEAAESYQRAIEAQPTDAVAHCKLGMVDCELGRWEQAAACFRRALELKGDFAEAYSNLAVVLTRQSNFDEAAACWRRVLDLQPDYAEAHGSLGGVLEQQGKLDEAAACWRRALELKPGFAEAHHNLGAVLEKQGRIAEAAECYRRTLELKPDFTQAHNNLGAVLAKQEKFDEAAVCVRRALELQPDFTEAHHHLGAVLAKQEKLDEAAACLRRALELKPDYAEAHGSLGAVLEKQGRFDEAAASYRRALELKPDFAEVYNNLGAVLAKQASFDEAMECFRKALENQPQLAAARSNALLALQYQPGVTLAQLAAAHGQYDKQHAAPLRSTWRPHDNEPDPDRRLRLGFVSADFGFHPVGVFLIRMLENLDRGQAETVCYSDRLNDDVMTSRLRAATTTWREVRALNDEQLADQIRSDRIDIVFDLAGHTSGNRLLAFARKPAPIQITWIGYVGTTGLAAMDYLLADRYEVPEAAEPHIQERVLRMPGGYVCYDPPSDAPSVSPLPAFTRGYVTFGSFNNFAKITPDVVEVWSRILERVQGSRLVLKYLGMNDPPVMRRMAGMFAQQGIDSTRLELLGWSCHEDLLREYQRIDVALDPFPYSGGLTTCEALWMGVPVVTCPGETFAGRHSLSHLSNVGLTETIADDLEGYVDLAVGLAADLTRLAGIRSRLRGQMAGSPLCDGKRFSEDLMGLLHGAWRQWCAQAAF